MLTTRAHQSCQQEAGPFRSSRCPESKPATQRTLDPMAWPEKPCRPKQLSQQAVRQYASSRYGRTESCRHRPPGRPVARQVHPSTGHDADEKLGLRAHPRPFATCHTCSCCLRSKVAKAYDHKHRHTSSSSSSSSAACCKGKPSPLTGLALLYTVQVIWYARPWCNFNLSIPSSDAVTACAISQVTSDVNAYA